MNALQGVQDCLEKGTGEITMPEDIRVKAHACIDRMLDFVAKSPGAITKPALRFAPNIGAA